MAVRVSLFLKGLIVGFCLAAPVGPIAALCVQRTIAKRWISGLVSGLGAAVADAFYGAVAAFGATMISEFLISERAWMQRIGGVILIFMGLRLFLTKPAEEKAAPAGNGNARGLTGDFLSTFFLTLTNPMTFVAFAAVFTTMGIGAVRGHPILTTELVGGVFLGSGDLVAHPLRGRPRPAPPLRLPQAHHHQSRHGGVRDRRGAGVPAADVPARSRRDFPAAPGSPPDYPSSSMV